MTVVENEWGFKCTWCGAEVDEVMAPDPYGGNPVGFCDKDGIVYVTTSD